MNKTIRQWPRSPSIATLEYDYNNRVLAKVFIHGYTGIWLQQEGIGQGPYPCLHWNMTTTRGYWPRSLYMPALEYDYNKRVLAKVFIHGCTGMWLQQEGIGQGPYPCMHWNMTAIRGYWSRSLSVHALEYDYNKRVLAKVLIRGCTGMWLQQEGIGQGPYPCMHLNMTTTRGYWPRSLYMPALEYDYNKRVLAKVLIHGCTGIWLQQEGIGQGPHPWMHWNVTTTRGYWPRTLSVHALEYDYNKRVFAKVLIHTCTGIWPQWKDIGQGPYPWLYRNMTTTKGYWSRSSSVAPLGYGYNITHYSRCPWLHCDITPPWGHLPKHMFMTPLWYYRRQCDITAIWGTGQGLFGWHQKWCWRIPLLAAPFGQQAWYYQPRITSEWDHPQVRALVLVAQ